MRLIESNGWRALRKWLCPYLWETAVLWRIALNHLGPPNEECGVRDVALLLREGLASAYQRFD